MQECHSISFYLFRSWELQVIYFQRCDQRDCLKTIFGGWLFVVLVVQITPQLHHSWTLLSRPKTSETSGVTREGGDDLAHRLPGLAHLGIQTHRVPRCHLTSPVRFALRRHPHTPYDPRTAAHNGPTPKAPPNSGGTGRTPRGQPGPTDALDTQHTRPIYFYFASPVRAQKHPPLANSAPWETWGSPLAAPPGGRAAGGLGGGGLRAPPAPLPPPPSPYLLQTTR